MQKIKSVTEATVAGKRVLVRADFNVPIENGVITNDLRIRTALPTLEYLHAQGAAQIIILMHLGRPEGKVVESLRVAPVEARLRELTKVPFEMHENLRFDAREEANDPAFAQELASLGDIYVNEAFADSHRAHASIVGIPKIIPGYAGLRFIEEVTKLSAALTPPQGALAIIGGAKFETKEPLITKLLALYNEVLLGGALGNDVIKARGMPFGSSLISSVPVPPEVASNERLLVPTDAFFVEIGEHTERVSSIADTRANESVIDIGPQTSALWSEKIKNAPFVLWNGPLGMYEDGYADGTDTLAQALADSKAQAVIGGGDTAAAVEKYKFDPARVFVSTGGGAMLQFLVDGTLPGIEALA
jgi:phosphoglycerate kinase